MAGETGVNISAGSGTSIDTYNVGPGTVGSGTEALRQALVIGDALAQANVAKVDSSGRVWTALHDEEITLLLKAMLVRLDLLCNLIDNRYSPPDQLGL